MYEVYILFSKKYNKTYVGFTNNLSKRVKSHNLGRVSYTKRYRPWEVIYTEKLSNYYFAQKREKYFKSGAGRRKLHLIIDNWRKKKALLE